MGGGNLRFAYVGNGGYDIVPVAGEPYPLDDIVTFCCNRVGIDSSEIDVTELTDMVKGFVISGPYTAGESIRSL
mgnify:FL=1